MRTSTRPRSTKKARSGDSFRVAATETTETGRKTATRKTEELNVDGDRLVLSPSPFQAADDPQPELGGARAVDDSVIEGQRDVADRPHRDLAVADNGSLCNPTDADDRDLRVVDDRRLEEARELARAGDRERRALQLLGLQCPGAGAVRKPSNFGVELLERTRIAGAYHGDN